MPEVAPELIEDKYLFTFQDETQIWISREVIETYTKLPFYDIITHSEKYDDGSYYIDMPSFPMNKVIHLLTERNMNFLSLDFKDRYGIYKTLVEYSIEMKNGELLDILFYTKELFYDYLEDNNYSIYKESSIVDLPCISMSIFNSAEKVIRIQGLFTPQRINELLYYSLLIKMMNITKAEITYDYASNIPIEYICPSCIKDIFPSLKEIKITGGKDDETLYVHTFSSVCGMTQLLYLISYYSISNVEIYPVKILADKIDNNLSMKLVTTHVFPNVTELYYDDDDASDESPDYRFLMNLLPMIDTIHIYDIMYGGWEALAYFVDDLVYTHSIRIDYTDYLILDFPHLKELLEKDLISFSVLHIDTSNSNNVKKLYYFENCKQDIDSVDIAFNNNKNYDDDDMRNSLERFFKSNILEHLNDLTISCILLLLQIYDALYNISIVDDSISTKRLKWISTLFSENKFNNIHKLKIDLGFIKKRLSTKYVVELENIMIKLISKASIVNIENYNMANINRLIPKGCFLNTSELILEIKDIPDNRFFELFTTNNFPQLKSIQLKKSIKEEWFLSFIKKLFNFFYNNNFPSSTTIELSYTEYSGYNYIYDPNTSIFRCKYDNNSSIYTIIGTKNMPIRKYEIETLFECINENKTQNIRSLALYIYDEEQLSKLMNCIITGKIPKLKEFVCNIDNAILDEQINIYKQQLNDSSFIQENHVYYRFNNLY
ncbi:hypothetical protein WA158_002449 [Blastocystis sp. Blastoise]